MESIWRQRCEIRSRKPLEEDMETEIAVVGAGMAGILIADALQRAGRKVIVLEADRIASGQTQNTTAKITAQHGLVYRRLIDAMGEAKAEKYALANQEALQAYRTMIRERGIDCEFEEQTAYVYGANAERLLSEVNAARALGLPASLTKEFTLPFPTAGAVKFERQAQFDPLKFLSAVAEDLTVFEKSPVQSVEGMALKTERGTVRAEQIVFACHFPFVNFPGLFFTRMHQERSYVLALENAPLPDGMFIGAEQPSYSLRTAGDLLLLGGGAHRTGENRAGDKYDELRRKAAEWFPGSRETACWSAQDCITPDHMPYIGRFAAGRPNWYVATGFQKWGMTSSMVSAMVLRDLLCGAESAYAALFDPGRFSMTALQGVAKEGGMAVKGLLKRFFQIPKETTDHLPVGHGGIVSYNGRKVGVYKDGQGIVYAVDVRCPHLGCQLEWNPDERSWDCPCHGSRFDYQGGILSGPAQDGLRHG